ncbi:MAG: ABC transporter ATP-binding protein [Candidatus Coatesbacteria bacterium]|nr:ABC transporter ATP-binding protein [Candidatus Coatesbacteria bacterium]
MKTGAESAVEVIALSKWFGDREVVSNVSFLAAKSESVGLLGPNGAGKTTMMRIIAGVLSQDSGRVLINGVDRRKNHSDAISAVGYMPERPPLYRDLSVESHLQFWAHLRDVPSDVLNDRIDSILSEVGLEEVRGTLAGRLSKGYGQRLNLAQTLVHDPSILILDEPTAGLDPEQIAQTRELIKRLAANKTVIISSHILADVARTCNRVVIVNSGRIVGESLLSSGASERDPGEFISELERLYLDTIHGA